MAKSFFTSTDNNWFTPTEHTRGPWDEHACHAGPPTGLIARALEQLIPEQRLTRLTVNLQRPIPYSGFRIITNITRQGRTVTLTEASLVDNDGKIKITAAALHLTESPAHPYPTHSQAPLNPKDAQPGPFPIKATLHNKPAFNGTGVETRYPIGDNDQPGPTTAWLKTVPLLPDEDPSPFQRICPLADCGNAFGRNADPAQTMFMNADLTLVLHRDPIGEWLGTRSVGQSNAGRLPVADAQLFDEKGIVGRALQTLVLRPN